MAVLGDRSGEPVLAGDWWARCLLAPKSSATSRTCFIREGRTILRVMFSKGGGMAIELSEEAFTLLYFLRERLVRVQKSIDAEPTLAGEELAAAVSDLSDWIGPGVP